jgi:predicted flap endonuclease-1-like 5' DNA nuclease
MSIQAIVKRKRKSIRGKGFSREELKEKGLSFKQALNMGIPIDIRRSTKHDKNVETLKTYLSIDTTKTYSEGRKQKAEATTPEATLDLAKVKGIGQKLSEKLMKAGIKDVNELAASSPEKIAKTIGVSEERASIFIENARSLLKG